MFFISELNAVETAKKEAKLRKKKQATPVVGDIGLLGEALPTLELLLKGSQGQTSAMCVHTFIISNIKNKMVLLVL